MTAPPPSALTLQAQHSVGFDGSSVVASPHYAPVWFPVLFKKMSRDRTGPYLMSNSVQVVSISCGIRGI